MNGWTNILRMHEKLFWGLPYCVFSTDRWLTVWCFFSLCFFSPPAPKKEGTLDRTAETRLGKGTRRRELLASTSSIQTGQPWMTTFSNRAGESDQVKSNSLEFCPCFFARPTARLICPFSPPPPQHVFPTCLHWVLYSHSSFLWLLLLIWFVHLHR